MLLSNVLRTEQKVETKKKLFSLFCRERKMERFDWSTTDFLDDKQPINAQVRYDA